MKNGKLIVVEGACDGIGKTTQYELLCKRIKEDGYEVANHHFPSYGTYQGAAVEKYLKGEYGQPSELSPYFVNSLYANDRGITWYTQLKPLFDEGKVCIDSELLELAAEDEFCFVENLKVAPYMDKINEIYLFKWNRKYPSDTKIDICIEDSYKCVSSEEFEGNSHERITLEVWKNE